MVIGCKTAILILTILDVVFYGIRRMLCVQQGLQNWIIL